METFAGNPLENFAKQEFKTPKCDICGQYQYTWPFRDLWFCQKCNHYFTAEIKYYKHYRMVYG